MEAVKCEAALLAAELGSLTAAAERLGYTQSGITRMLNSLEEELGFALFIRGKKGVRLTENGKAMQADLREKSVDCCFCAEQSDADCDWIPLYDDELVVWLPKDHALAGARHFPVEMLETEPFVHTLPGHDTDQDRLLAKLHLRPRTCFTTRDGFTTYNMVEAGVGISFNQRLISQKWNQNVAEVPFDPPQYVPLGIAVPSQKDASPAAKKLIECAKQRIKALTAQ